MGTRQRAAGEVGQEAGDLTDETQDPDMGVYQGIAVVRSLGIQAGGA
ncbi:hypothetical protein [Actinoallomurus sp. CA-142502]